MPVKKIYTGAEIARYESCAVRKYDYRLSCNLFSGAYNNRNGPECTEMDRNGPEWASITGMDIKINLFYVITIINVEISVFNDIAPFEVHMSTVGGLLHG